jgi:adenine phosphoribosyltransferase
MHPLASRVVDVPDFPKPGILFRDITPLLRSHFGEAITALDSLWTEREWMEADAVAGVESRGFILAAALAEKRGKGFVPIRKKGKLPPPVVDRDYSLEYGSGVLEMQPGEGRLILVDDVLATGGTLAASAALATDAGFRVVHTGVLIDLGLVREFHVLGAAPRSVIRYGS